MDFASTDMITDDLEPVIEFDEQVTWVSAVRPALAVAELHLPSCKIAFGPAQTVRQFAKAAQPADNHTVIVEFQGDDALVRQTTSPAVTDVQRVGFQKESS